MASSDDYRENVRFLASIVGAFGMIFLGTIGVLMWQEVRSLQDRWMEAQRSINLVEKAVAVLTATQVDQLGMRIAMLEDSVEVMKAHPERHDTQIKSLEGRINELRETTQRLAAEQLRIVSELERRTRG